MTEKDAAPVIIINDTIFEVRGERVMLDSRVADAFGTQTKRVNEAVSRNKEKFSAKHSFKLSGKEWEFLRSQSATSKMGRGGARYAPRVYTMKGVARLATVLETDAALHATDMIIDTFVMVYEQVSGGAKQISISNSSGYLASKDEKKAVRTFRKKLFKALNSLLDTVVDPNTDQTLRDASQEIGSQALRHVHERLRQKGLDNAKLEADTGLVLAETEKLLAEARRTNSEAKINDMDAIEKQIVIIKKLIEMSKNLEPVEFIDILDSFDADIQTPLLEAPAATKKKQPKRRR